jgi:hypothetical protein
MTAKKPAFLKDKIARQKKAKSKAGAAGGKKSGGLKFGSPAWQKKYGKKKSR